MTSSNSTGNGGRSSGEGIPSGGDGTNTGKSLKTNTDRAYTPPETARTGMAPKGMIGTEKSVAKMLPLTAVKIREAQRKVAQEKERDAIKAEQKGRFYGDKTRKSLLQHDFKRAKGRGSLRPVFNKGAGRER
ncbi:hypothetical protein [Parvularcula marina]|uniref:Uncharacterized protein n=1 Tax=Parvularcula marina TaxID=2292771 RepID=A0A371RL61_9PROT|nr:hypothetical protein [Parvularcula marina]RFB06210.1 hypothetical protein DX908_13610 [Parvularcula marina]